MSNVTTVKQTGPEAIAIDVRLDGQTIGSVYPSARRWARGWAMTTAAGKDLGDQPRKADAIATLVAFVTSPMRNKR